MCKINQIYKTIFIIRKTKYYFNKLKSNIITQIIMYSFIHAPKQGKPPTTPLQQKNTGNTSEERQTLSKDDFIN